MAHASVPETVIFSDLDGTFLDERHRPVLTRDDARMLFDQVAVVWVSSRTAEELLAVQAELGHSGDAIGENGGVLLTRDRILAQRLGRTEAIDGAWVVRLAAFSREETDSRVRAAFHEARAPLVTMDDLGAEQLARRSGYTVADAERALKRRASVLLVDADTSDPHVSAALQALRESGATAVHGGRWISVLFGADKGRAVRAWLAACVQQHGAEPSIIVGVGDADNDEALLRAVTLPFAVRRGDRGYASALEQIPGVRLLQRDGHLGWIEMLEHLSAFKKDPR